MECNNIIEIYKNSCNLLAQQINDYLFEGSRNFYWVAQDIGGICDFDDSDFLTPSEMVLILENKLAYDDYVNWRDSNINNESFINLKSWINGCRHDMLNKK